MAGRPKGLPRTGGRKAGTPNKLTRTIKEAIEDAFEEVGAAKYLAQMAKEQPAAFLTLLGKVLPTQVNAKVEGQQGYHFVIETVGPNAEADQPPTN